PTFASKQSATARAERDRAIFNQVTAEADRLRSTDVSLAAQLDLTAHRMRPHDQDLYTDLVTTENAALSTPLTAHTDTVTSVALSSDGHIMASGGQHGTIRLWDLTDPAHPALLGEHVSAHAGIVTVALRHGGP